METEVQRKTKKKNVQQRTEVTWKSEKQRKSGIAQKKNKKKWGNSVARK